MSQISEFKFDGTVLEYYEGPGGDVVIPEGTTGIESFAFLQSDITGITIPEGVTFIGEEAFSRCRGLTCVVIPDSVTTIGKEAFRKCARLESVTIGNGVTEIGSSAFYACENLTSVRFGSSVATIGRDAFRQCRSLESVRLPESIRLIETDAFCHCDSLSRLTLPDHPVTLEPGAFSHCKKLAGNAHGFAMVHNVLYGYYGSAGDIILPGRITVVENSAFDSCAGLTGISMTQAAAGCLSWAAAQNASFGVAASDGNKWHFYGFASKTYSDNFSDFVHSGKWNAYDLELINNGPAYKYKAPARLLGSLGRIANPVELTEECKALHLEYLTRNAKKLISIAENLRCPAIVVAMKEHGILNEKNKKAIARLLSASAVPEIAAVEL